MVEVRLDGRAWLDLEGIPSTGQAVKEIRHRLREAVWVEPRLGMAPGPFTAARAAARSRPGRLLMVAEARRLLAPLPVEELALEPEQLERLRFYLGPGGSAFDAHATPHFGCPPNRGKPRLFSSGQTITLGPIDEIGTAHPARI